jgi:hypothetical protein
MKLLPAYELAGLGVSAVSCWEGVKRVEYWRLSLPCRINEGGASVGVSGSGLALYRFGAKAALSFRQCRSV